MLKIAIICLFAFGVAQSRDLHSAKDVAAKIETSSVVTPAVEILPAETNPVETLPAAETPVVSEKPSNIFNEKLVEGVVVEEREPEVKPSSRQARKRVTSIKDAMRCGFDVNCFLDTVETVVRERRDLILAEADTRYLTSSQARAISSESPSELAEAVQDVVSRMVDLGKDSFSGWFREGKSEDNDEEQTVQEEAKEEDKQGQEEENQAVNGESRGKKKKKLKSLMKLLILGAVLKAKLTVLLQLLSAALQIKFFFIALAGLLINKIRLWYDLKKGHHPQKVIYYEHAQHQHHYDHLEDEHHGGGGGFWGRAYEVPQDEEESAQDMAYKAQKPIPWSPQQ